MNWQERGEKVLAQGFGGTNSKRSTAYVQGVYPTHVVSGEGCYLTDVLGRKYIDFVSGLGTNILGYNFPPVMEAVAAQLKRGGPNYSLPSFLEVEVAELIRDMIPSMEMVRFLKTGNEATLAAVRIARAFLKSDQRSMPIVEGYHGHGDFWTSQTPPAIGVEDQFFIYPMSWKGINKDRVRKQFFICEPIELVSDDSRKEELIKRKKEGDLLILDEVVTGFRVPKYTVGEWWGLKPDLTCLGKGIANNYPLSVVGGSKELMGSVDYFISSTFSGEAMSLAAAKATLTEIRKKNMDDFHFYAMRFQDRFNEICKPIGTKLTGYGTRAQSDFYENENTVLLYQELCKSGILMGRAHFYNFAHMESGIEEFVFNVLSDCVNKVKSGNVKLEGKPPRPTFRR